MKKRSRPTAYLSKSTPYHTQDAYGKQYVLFVGESKGMLLLRAAVYHGKERRFELSKKARQDLAKMKESLLSLGCSQKEVDSQWFAGKRIRTAVPAVRREAVANIFRKCGWEVRPEQYATRRRDSQTLETCRKDLALAQRRGLAIDVSNLICKMDSETCNRALAFQHINLSVTERLLVILEALKACQITPYLFVDGQTRIEHWRLKGYSLLESQAGQSVDAMMLAEAEAQGMPVLSGDSFTDQPVFDSYLLPMAEKGQPVLHKFSVLDSIVSIPDFGFSVNLAEVARLCA